MKTYRVSLKVNANAHVTVAPYNEAAVHGRASAKGNFATTFQAEYAEFVLVIVKHGNQEKAVLARAVEVG